MPFWYWNSFKSGKTWISKFCLNWFQSLQDEIKKSVDRLLKILSLYQMKDSSLYRRAYLRHSSCVNGISCNSLFKSCPGDGGVATLFSRDGKMVGWSGWFIPHHSCRLDSTHNCYHRLFSKVPLPNYHTLWLVFKEIKRIMFNFLSICAYIFRWTYACIMDVLVV